MGKYRYLIAATVVDKFEAAPTWGTTAPTVGDYNGKWDDNGVKAAREAQYPIAIRLAAEGTGFPSRTHDGLRGSGRRRRGYDGEPEWRNKAITDGYLSPELKDPKIRCTLEDKPGSITTTNADCNLPPEFKRLAGWGNDPRRFVMRHSGASYKLTADDAGLQITHHVGAPKDDKGAERTRRIPCDFLLHPAAVLPETTGSEFKPGACKLEARDFASCSRKASATRRPTSPRGE